MASTILIPSQINPLVEGIGRLIGLLVADDSAIGFDFDWFADVPAQLAAIPQRKGVQWQLLTDLMGVASLCVSGRHWYPLPTLSSNSPIHLVLAPDPSGDGGVVGVGLYTQWAQGDSSVIVWAFAPIVDTAGSPLVVSGSPQHPIEIGLTCILAEPVVIAGTNCAGIEICASLPLDGVTTPGCELTFTAAPPAAATNAHLAPAPPTPVTSLQQLIDAKGWVDVILGTTTVTAWLDKQLGSIGVKVGDVLIAAGLVVDKPVYALADLSALVDQTPVALAESWLAGALKLLAGLAGPIIKLGDAGGISIFANSLPGPDTEYGLRLCIADVALATAKGTKFVLQLGKMLDADTDVSNWVTRGYPPANAIVDPGVSLTLLAESADTPPKPSFRPKLDLVSIGLDLDGASGNPLVAVMGVTLGSAQPRFLLSYEPSDGLIYWGAAIQADKLGIPLGNGLSGTASNPVAQNLMSSGSSGAGCDQQAIDPTFSVSIAGMSHSGKPMTLDVQLHSNLGSGNQVWVPVQRSFGPLHCGRIGIAWPDENPDLRLDLLFDGGVTLAVLDVELQGLAIGLPLASPSDISNYSLDLKGLAITADTGSLTISAGFLKSADGVSPVTYDGAALIKAADWTIVAEGSYASLNGHPSMFIFAQLGADLGGPPFCFITGLCAGFGYNRSLRLPGQDEVPSFPLLAGIANPAAIGGGNASPMIALAKLETDNWVAPTQGVNWIAAGVQFTSFELVQSNVVATAVMAQDLQLAILGVSRIKLSQTGPQFAYAELGLSVVIRPADGFFGVSAVLSPNSYLLTQDCHLTGGFAFWIWYSGAHRGDFVVTLGGYHPAFIVPAHYPNEPRLAFSWQIDSNLTVQGDAYFALTPSCAMGGGELDVLFHDGDLRAWFTAQTDFLFTWQPFYFIGDVRVGIGASYRLNLLFTSVTVSVELGADLNIWGPPTGGNVHVSWYIISFTIGFGADPRAAATSYQDWDCFKTLIPARPAAAPQALALLGAPASDPAALGMLTLSMSGGLLGTVSAQDKTWLARADALTFAVATPIPATQAVLDGTPPVAYVTPVPGNVVGVRPMGVTAMNSVLTVTLTGPDGVVDLSQGWTWSPTFAAAPAALWGAPLLPGATPTVPSADMLPSCLHGISGLQPPEVALTGPCAFAATDFNYFTITDSAADGLPLHAADAPAPAQPQAGPALKRIADTIATAGVGQRRSDLFAALRGFGYDPVSDGATGAICDNVDFSYPDAPMLGAPWAKAA